MEDLRIGIVAEGKSDAAVITNILKGILKVNKSQFKYILPQVYKDETELNDTAAKKDNFSNWTLVKQACIDENEINEFLNSQLDEERILIIQIDTAERNLKGYEVLKPEKSKTKKYSAELRTNVIQKINEWLDEPYENIFYAIAIEEIDAWLLTLIHTKKNDTGEYLNVKSKFNKEINKNTNRKFKNLLKLKDAFIKYGGLSEPFSKPKELNKARNKNHSLNLFCASLEGRFSIK